MATTAEERRALLRQGRRSTPSDRRAMLRQRDEAGADATGTDAAQPRQREMEPNVLYPLDPDVAAQLTPPPDVPRRDVSAEQREVEEVRARVVREQLNITDFRNFVRTQRNLRPGATPTPRDFDAERRELRSRLLEANIDLEVRRSMDWIANDHVDVPVLRETQRGTQRGLRQGARAASTMQLIAGMGDEFRYGDWARQNQRLREMQDERLSPIAESASIGEFFSAVGNNPLAVYEQIVTSFASSAPPTIAGTAIAGPAGTVAGAGSSSAMIEFAGEFENQLIKEGIDTTDPRSVRQAFEENPQLIEKAKRTAATRAGVIGMVDALSAGVAGRVLRPANATTRSGAALRTAGEVGLQSAAGGTGEALGSLSIGEELRIGEIGLEALAEIGPGSLEVAVNTIQDRSIAAAQLEAREKPGRAERTLVPSNDPSAIGALGESLGMGALSRSMADAPTLLPQVEVQFDRIAPEVPVEERLELLDRQDTTPEQPAGLETPAAPLMDLLMSEVGVSDVLDVVGQGDQAAEVQGLQLTLADMAEQAHEEGLIDSPEPTQLAGAVRAEMQALADALDVDATGVLEAEPQSLQELADQARQFEALIDRGDPAALAQAEQQPAGSPLTQLMEAEGVADLAAALEADPMAPLVEGNERTLMDLAEEAQQRGLISEADPARLIEGVEAELAATQQEGERDAAAEAGQPTQPPTTLRVINETLDEQRLSMPTAFEQFELALQAGEQQEATRTEAQETGGRFAVSPDVWRDLPRSDKALLRRRGVVVDEDAAESQRAVVGDRVYDAMFNEMLQRQQQMREAFIDDVLAGPENYPPHVALAAYLRRRYDEMPAADRVRHQRRAEHVDPASLAEGDTFTVMGETFRVESALEGPMIVGGGMELMVEGLPPIPVDPGSVESDLYQAESFEGVEEEVDPAALSEEDRQADQEAQEAIAETESEVMFETAEVEATVMRDLTRAHLAGRQAVTVEEIRSLAATLKQVLQQAMGRETLMASGALTWFNRVVQAKTVDGARNAYSRAINRARRVVKRSEHARQLAQTQRALSGMRKRRRTYQSDRLRDLANQIVMTFREKGVSDQRQRGLEGLREAMANNPDLLIPARVAQQLDLLSQTPLEDLNTHQLKGLQDAIESIEHQAATFNRMVVNGQARDRRRVAAAASQEVAGVVGGARSGAGRRLLREQRVDPRTGRLKRERINPIGWALRQHHGYLENAMPATLVRVISGSNNTITAQVLYYDVAEAQKRWMGAKHREADLLAALYGELGLSAEDLSLMSDHLQVRRSAIRQIAGQDFGMSRAARETFTTEAGEELNWTAGERMHLLALVEDETTFDLIVFDEVPIHLVNSQAGLSHGITAQDVQNLRAATTDTEWRIINHMVERVNTQFKEDYRRWTLRERGFDDTADAPHTHFPRRRVKDEEDAPAEVTADNFQPQAVDRVGITKQRTGDRSDAVRVDDLFKVFEEHVSQLYGVVELGPAIRNAKNLLNSRLNGANGIPVMLDRARRGRAIRERFESQYNTLAQDVMRRPPRMSERMEQLQTLNRMAVRGILGLSPQIAAYSPAALWTAATRMRKRDLVRALSSGDGFDKSIDGVMRANDWLRERMEGIGSAVVTEGGLHSARADDIAFAWARAGDRMVMRTIFGGAMRQAKAEGHTGDAQVERALQITERVAKETQPSYDGLHISGHGVDARSNPAWKIWVNFRSDASKIVDVVMNETLDMMDNPSVGTIYRGMRNITMAVLMQSLQVAVTRWGVRALLLGMGYGLGQLLGTGDDEIEELENIEQEMGKVVGDGIVVAAGSWLGGDIAGEVLVRKVLAPMIDAAGGEDFAAGARDRPYFPAGPPLVFDQLRRSVERSWSEGGKMFAALAEGDAAEAVGRLAKAVAAISVVVGVPASFWDRAFTDIVEAANKEESKAEQGWLNR